MLRRPAADMASVAVRCGRSTCATCPPQISTAGIDAAAAHVDGEAHSRQWCESAAAGAEGVGTRCRLVATRSVPCGWAWRGLAAVAVMVVATGPLLVCARLPRLLTFPVPVPPIRAMLCSTKGCSP
eukprot:360622-Chlamydomonas_euryale.AAC.16